MAGCSESEAADRGLRKTDQDYPREVWLLVAQLTVVADNLQQSVIDNLVAAVVTVAQQVQVSVETGLELAAADN